MMPAISTNWAIRISIDDYLTCDYVRGDVREAGRQPVQRLDGDLLPGGVRAVVIERDDQL
jgi:hypothetical protein